MLKNKSYFKKSMGDEAGAAAKKGAVTSTNRGKVYFNAWSMDVKFEGENVVRHLDLTTHNHMSSPPNSPPWPHLDTMAVAMPEREEKCRLRPYKEGCEGNKTPHHCVPDHCFKETPSKGGRYYPGAVKHADGLCVCVEGATKSTTPTGERVRKKDFASEELHEAALAEHGRIHLKFDKLEKELGNAGTPKNSAALGDLEDKAAEAISEVTGCDKEDLKKQMREHHQSKGLDQDTKLRADPCGRAKLPPYDQMGASNVSATGML